MDISKYVAQLREDLASAAAAGDEQTRSTAAALGAAIEPAARLAVMNALADLAAEVTEALGDRSVDVRLDGRDVRVVVSDPTAAAPPPPPYTPGPDAGDISRITLRLVEQIKNQAEQAAASQGVSLNSWVAQAVQGALQGSKGSGPWGGGGPWGAGRGGPGGGPRGGGRRSDQELKGWVQG